MSVVDRPHATHRSGSQAAHTARTSLHSPASPQSRHWSLNVGNGPGIEETGAADNLMFVVGGRCLGQVLDDIRARVVDPLRFRVSDIDDGIVFTVGAVVVAIIVMVSDVLLVISHH